VFSIQWAVVVSANGKRTHWPFSLTPALSRWERENGIQRWAGAGALGTTTGGPGCPLSQRERVRVRESAQDESGAEIANPRRGGRPSPFLGGGEKVAAGRMRGVAANADARNPSPRPSPLIR
jgi:hypothetical protein